LPSSGFFAIKAFYYKGALGALNAFFSSPGTVTGSFESIVGAFTNKEGLAGSV